jgi:hypothetical protein
LIQRAASIGTAVKETIKLTAIAAAASIRRRHKAAYDARHESDGIKTASSEE